MFGTRLVFGLLYHHLVNIIQHNIDNASRPTSRLKARDKRGKKNLVRPDAKSELVRPRLDCKHVDIRPGESNGVHHPHAWRLLPIRTSSVP
jgi:hypothetical protein